MSYQDNHSSSYPHAPGFHRNAPETSIEAAESVADEARTRSAKALTFVVSQGHRGATSDEVAAAYEWDRYSSRPRMAELHKRGEIVDSGNRRKGESGRNQIVWIAKTFGPVADELQGEMFAHG